MHLLIYFSTDRATIFVHKGFTKAETGVSSGLQDVSVVFFGLCLPYFSHLLNFTRIVQFAYFLHSIAAIVFALSSLLNSFWLYVVVTTISQLLLGLSCAFASGLMSAIVYALYPDHRGIIASLTQASFEIGYLIGPLIGQLLYNFGGFLAPFLACGLSSFGFAALLMCFMLPHSGEPPTEELSLKTGFLKFF